LRTSGLMAYNSIQSIRRDESRPYLLLTTAYCLSNDSQHTLRDRLSTGLDKLRPSGLMAYNSIQSIRRDESRPYFLLTTAYCLSNDSQHTLRDRLSTGRDKLRPSGLMAYNSIQSIRRDESRPYFLLTTAYCLANDSQHKTVADPAGRFHPQLPACASRMGPQRPDHVVCGFRPDSVHPDTNTAVCQIPDVQPAA